MLSKCCHEKGIESPEDSRSLVPTGAPDRNRTCDLWYRKPTLYPLSYGGVPIEVITAARPPLTGTDASAQRRAGRSGAQSSESKSWKLSAVSTGRATG